jgi:glycosyltransferase involved in cell wall biosynthesis
VADRPGTGRPAELALVAHRFAAPHPTGIGRYYAELAQGLAAVADPATHAYTVASPHEDGAPPWLAPPLRRADLGGLRKARALAWSLLRSPRVDSRLGYPDLVHVLQPWAPIPTRARLVATVHDLMPLLHPEWHGPLEAWSFRSGVRHVADHADLLIADSAHTAALVTEHLGVDPARLRVVWIGAGDEFRARPTSEERAATCARHGVAPGRFLLAVGAVSQRKNLTVVLRALTRLAPDVLGPVALLVAGPPGKGADAIEAEVDELGLRDRVRFAGFVPDADLPVLVGASLALVHPSRDEGFGITPIEAMAAGVPALVSAVGSVPEVAGAAAVLLDPDDADAWAAAITALATDEDHRAAVVARGDRHQARFTWRAAAEATLAVHDEVLGR